MASDDESYGDDLDVQDWDHSNSANVRVCIRLRPMNKLEASRRSKNCVEFHDDPHIVTVDSPLEGEYDFGFDRVFDEDASQADVFEHTAAPVARQLFDGYNCAVMAYGQTGSGKTHTMMGPGGGTIGSLEKSRLRTDEEDSDERVTPEVPPRGALPENGPASGTGGKMADQDLGMIPRTISAIFALLENSPPSMEYTVRCSYVEIYLEKILDLLNPASEGGGGSVLGIVANDPSDEAAGAPKRGEDARIVGASELCCIDKDDVFALLDRGNASRTVSSTKMNTDSSRSHAIFIIRLEQKNTVTGEIKKSVLHLVDLAGSEMAGKTENQNFLGTSAVQEEAKMINKALSSLTNFVRAQMKRQKGSQMALPSSVDKHKLTRLLAQCFGGNCMTTVILTASPSSYNIGETISAIRFGQCCRQIKNPAVVNAQLTPDYYKKRLSRSEKREADLILLVKALASECRDLKREASNGTYDESLHDGPLWESIHEILSDDEEESDYVVIVRKGSTNETVRTEEMTDYESGDLHTAGTDSTPFADKENAISELKSEVAVLRTQNENLSAESKKVVQDLIDAKNEIQTISQRKIEVEHNLRTSQFRENEATVFLRQFRRFYRRLLKNKAAQGTGGTQEITAKTPGVPDLNDLIDVDTLLVESGLIEEEEMHDDTAAGTYRPSGAALLRSTAGAKKAAKNASALERDGSVRTFNSSVHSETSASDGHSHLENISETGSAERENEPVGGGADAGAGSSPEHSDHANATESIRTSMRSLSGASTAERQRQLHTPGGRLLAAKEKELERDFLQMSEKCIELQQELETKKAELEAALSRYNKKRETQESITLRQQLDKKTHDLQAIIWKMNELHLINKTYNDKMANREQHVTYLEENLADLQNTNRRLMKERHEAELKLREELDNLKVLVDGATVPLWQFGERSTTSHPASSRIIVPFVSEATKLQLSMDPPVRRVSEGGSEASFDSEAPEQITPQKGRSSAREQSAELVDAETQTKESQVTPETSEIAIQTESLPELAGAHRRLERGESGSASEDDDDDSDREEEVGPSASDSSSDVESMDPEELEEIRNAADSFSGGFDRAPEATTPNGAHSSDQGQPANNAHTDVARVGVSSDDSGNELFRGGKPADFIPRQFVKKTGPGIKAGVLKDCRRKLSREDSRRKSLSKKKSGSSSRKKRSSRDGSTKRLSSKTTSQVRRGSRMASR